MKLAVVTLSMLAATILWALAAQGAETKDSHMTIVAFGDSLTAGYGLVDNQSFPAQLEAALKARGKDVSVVNAGVSGDTSNAALQRLDWSLPENAEALIVELGGNDALQGLPPEGTRDALAKIIEAAQAKGVPVLLAGMEAPRNMGKDYIDAFAAIYPALAAKYGVVFSRSSSTAWCSTMTRRACRCTSACGRPTSRSATHPTGTASPRPIRARFAAQPVSLRR